ELIARDCAHWNPGRLTESDDLLDARIAASARHGNVVESAPARSQSFFDGMDSKDGLHELGRQGTIRLHSVSGRTRACKSGATSVASFISDAKIGPANMLIVEECLAGSLERDAANFHHVSVMRNLERVIHVLAHQQDGYALFGYIADQGKNFVDQNRREAKRRFIEHEKLRFRHQAAPDGAHLLFAAGESARVLPATFFKA